MLCGIPGSGKSYFAKCLSHQTNAKIHSSDDLRQEILGNINYQDKNQDIFNILHSRIKADLIAGKSVIYDDTNINKKRRIAFLQELSKIRCCKKCIVIATPYGVCLKNNSLRDRKVPEEVIRKMYMNWQPPHYSEGWEYIRYYHPFPDEKIEIDFNKMMTYDQKNSHHEMSLGAHMACTAMYLMTKSETDANLLLAGMLHDIGKPFTQTFVNSKGETTNEAHYYQHHCVGAYDLMCIDKKISDDGIVDISNLIYYHMHPYISWAQSEKVKEKDRKLLGDEMFNRIMLLHEADQASH